MNCLTGEDTMGNGMRFYDIAKALKARREELGYSMHKVAMMMGTSTSSIHYWENGRKAPVLVSLLHWCDVLGMEIHLAVTEEK